MKLFAILCLLILCITASAKVLYKTVKEDGSVVYSDIPSKGATPVNLSAMNSVVVPALNKVASSNTQSKKQQQINDDTKYTVSIISPLAEESLRNNSGHVTIQVSASPKRAGKFQLVMDNQVVSTQSSNVFELESVERGAHKIEVNFLDNSGKILASSQQQTFYLHKASALINAN